MVVSKVFGGKAVASKLFGVKKMPKKTQSANPKTLSFSRIGTYLKKPLPLTPRFATMVARPMPRTRVADGLTRAQSVSERRNFLLQRGIRSIFPEVPQPVIVKKDIGKRMADQADLAPYRHEIKRARTDAIKEFKPMNSMARWLNRGRLAILARRDEHRSLKGLAASFDSFPAILKDIIPSYTSHTPVTINPPSAIPILPSTSRAPVADNSPLAMLILALTGQAPVDSNPSSTISTSEDMVVEATPSTSHTLDDSMDTEEESTTTPTAEEDSMDAEETSTVVSTPLEGSMDSEETSTTAPITPEDSMDSGKTSTITLVTPQSPSLNQEILPQSSFPVDRTSSNPPPPATTAVQESKSDSEDMDMDKKEPWSKKKSYWRSSRGTNKSASSNSPYSRPSKTCKPAPGSAIEAVTSKKVIADVSTSAPLAVISPPSLDEKKDAVDPSQLVVPAPTTSQAETPAAPTRPTTPPRPSSPVAPPMSPITPPSSPGSFISEELSKTHISFEEAPETPPISVPSPQQKEPSVATDKSPDTDIKESSPATAAPDTTTSAPPAIPHPFASMTIGEMSKKTQVTVPEPSTGEKKVPQRHLTEQEQKDLVEGMLAQGRLEENTKALEKGNLFDDFKL